MSLWLLVVLVDGLAVGAQNHLHVFMPNGAATHHGLAQQSSGHILAGRAESRQIALQQGGIAQL